MPITSGFVQLPDDSANTGKKEDHVVLTGGNYREVVSIGDPNAAGIAAIAPVDATNGLMTQSVVGGATTGTAVTSDSNGTLQQYLRGLVTILADMWDSANHRLNVFIQNATLAVTQSGTWVSRTQDGSGNAITSHSSALDVSLRSIGGTIDSNNSSTATLTSGSTFTGTGTDVTGYAAVAILVYADQNSAANGVKLEWSSDNSNWVDASLYTFTSGGSAPNSGQTFQTGIRAKYFRVVYTNGGTNQGSFILNTLLLPGPMVGDVSDLSLIPVDGDHGVQTKAIIYGKSTAGGSTYVAVKVNPSGSVAVDNSGQTQPISAVSLPLPTGASTDAALKPALTALALQVTASGDTTLLSSGTHKIHRIKMSNSHATTALTAGIKIPSQNSGAAFDKTYLPAAGGLGIWTFPGGYLQTTSEALSINLSTAGQVECTVYYE